MLVKGAGHKAHGASGRGLAIEQMRPHLNPPLGGEEIEKVFFRLEFMPHSMRGRNDG
jgi:hypothetical protein